MDRQKYDIVSKWLLHHQGRGPLLIGGLKQVRRYRAMPGEVSQTRRFPDGLLEVVVEGEAKPAPVLVEVATYPEKRVLKQALQDLTLSYHALGVLPDLLLQILARKGRQHIAGNYEVVSRFGTSRLRGEWKPTELWTLDAAEYLATADVSAVPWTVLMNWSGPPEALLERCRDRIEHDAAADDQANLLAAAQVLAHARFPQRELLDLLGGTKAIIESPLLVEMRAATIRNVILEVLKDRFGPVPRDVVRHLGEVLKENRLQKLAVFAGKCPDLAAFKEALLL